MKNEMVHPAVEITDSVWEIEESKLLKWWQSNEDPFNKPEHQKDCKFCLQVRDKEARGEEDLTSELARIMAHRMQLLGVGPQEYGYPEKFDFQRRRDALRLATEMELLSPGRLNPQIRTDQMWEAITEEINDCLEDAGAVDILKMPLYGKVLFPDRFRDRYLGNDRLFAAFQNFIDYLKKLNGYQPRGNFALASSSDLAKIYLVMPYAATPLKDFTEVDWQMSLRRYFNFQVGERYLGHRNDDRVLRVLSAATGFPWPDEEKLKQLASNMGIKNFSYTKYVGKEINHFRDHVQGKVYEPEPISVGLNLKFLLAQEVNITDERIEIVS